MRTNFIYRVLFSLLGMTQAFSGMAQVPVIQWQKSLGGSGNDYANSVQQTADGGYIVAGYTSSVDGDVSGNHGGNDMWVVKLDNAGNIQWQKTLGGSGDDVATYVQQTADAGYIIAGNTSSNDGDVSGNHGNSDAWVVKLNSAGNIQWQKTYGGLSNEAANSVQQLADGGYILGCSALSEYGGDIIGSHGANEGWIVKISPVGVIEWSLCLGGLSYDYARQVKQTADGGFIMGGYGSSVDGDLIGNHGNMDFWMVKLDNIQERQWKKTFGGTGTDILSSVTQTTDGGFIAAGHVYSQDGDIAGSGFHGPYLNDYWIIKLDTAGGLQWKKALGGSGNDLAQSIQQTTDGGYIVFGYSTSNDGDVSGNHGYVDYWIVKLNSTGTIQWQKSLGGTGQEGYNNIPNEVDGAHSIQQTTDGGFILAGYSKSNDGDVSGNHGNFDYWVVKLGNCTAPQPTFSYTNSGNVYSFNYTGSNPYTTISWDFGDNTPVSNGANPTHSYAAFGSYTVCVTVTNNCGSNTTCQTIKNCTLPQPTFSYTNSGNAYNFNYSGGNSYTTISWDFGDNTPVSNNANPTHTYATSGSYIVCVTVANDCGSNTACQTINTKVTGINNIPGFANISIYPNPTTQEIMIDNAEEGTVLDIYNITGSLVLHTKLKGDKDNVDVSSLSSGIYLMRFADKEGRQGSSKFVKQ
jgi:PKD repeat protein